MAADVNLDQHEPADGVTAPSTAQQPPRASTVESYSKPEVPDFSSNFQGLLEGAGMKHNEASAMGGIFGKLIQFFASIFGGMNNDGGGNPAPADTTGTGTRAKRAATGTDPSDPAATKKADQTEQTDQTEPEQTTQTDQTNQTDAGDFVANDTGTSVA